MTEVQNEESDLDLVHYLDIVLRRRWIVLAVTGITFISSILYVFTVRPVFQASALIVIEKERGASAVSADGTMIESSNEDYYQTQYKLLKSDSLLRQIYDKLKLDSAPDFQQPNGVLKLDRAISIVPVSRSRLVYLRVESHDARLAAQVSNSLAQTFVEQNLANQLFISKEVLNALQIRGADASSEKTYAALPAVVNNTLIQQLKAQNAKLQSEYADMAAKFTLKHPAMIALRSNIAALEGQIRAETDKIVQSLKTELSGQLKGNNMRIVDVALVPEHPVRPKKLTTLILGLLVGGALGLGMALLVEVLDQSIRTQEDVERRLDLPFLGIVPQTVFDGAPYQAMLSKELSLTSESIRNLRTMVDFAGIGGKAKALLVTSTVQDEGKSFVAANLAVAFAQLGERVLIINGDLRRPSIHKAFSIHSERGLSEFLAGGTKLEELREFVQPTDVPNLQLLPCGIRPPNPSELLNTPRVAALMVWAKSNFDRVIVDCTPMFPIHDTLLWGRHVTSAVFVARYGRTRLPLVSKACQRLKNAEIDVLGIAVNAAKPGGLAYASYGYYYQQYYHAYQHEATASKPS